MGLESREATSTFPITLNTLSAAGALQAETAGRG